MGNASSQSSPSSPTMSCAQRRGGILDPRNQIENVYERLIAQNEHVQQQFRKAFKSVRILVVGKTGSGKSTLIRLLLGGMGPRSVAFGDIGNQDILTEWRYSDPALPLVIHDSNGIDVHGKQRIAHIKEFLDARLATGVKFAERVHAVWYVFQASDKRVLNDGGLLELLCDYGSKKLPLLLIMTHTDVQEDFPGMHGMILEKLLAKVQDEERRKKLSEMLVKVGNKMSVDIGTGNILLVRDKKGMEMVFERTKQLMQKELWRTWVACQAVDMNAKLEESANLIVRCQRLQCWASSFLAAIPGLHQIQLFVMYGSVTCGLTKIWNVQQEFEKAITYRLLYEERGPAVTRNLATTTVGALALGSSLAVTVLTSGIAAPSIAVSALGSAWSQAGSTSTELMSYALMVVGSIIYVKTHHETMANDGKATVDDYLRLCQEFLESTWAQRVSGFSERYTSIWEKFFQQRRQKERMRRQIVVFFKQITREERMSLFTPTDDGADTIDVDHNEVEEESEEEEEEEKILLSLLIT